MISSCFVKLTASKVGSLSELRLSVSAVQFFLKIMEASMKKKNEIVIKKASDHWAFLEHIEAPMWADLTLEANSGYGDVSDDDWLNTSHPFHQWSARELRSKFAHPDVEVVTLGVDSRGLASPALPSSVSKLRGKHCNNKNWEGINPNDLLDKQEGLSRRRFQLGSSFDQEVKPKSKPNVSRPNGLLSAKLESTFQRNARGKTKSLASCSNLASSSSSMDNNKMGESSTRSTTTSENTLPQQDYKEVSTQPCEEKSKSSSVRSFSFAKSCVTVKASRVQQQQKYVKVSSQPCDRKSGSSSVNSVSLRKSNVTREVSDVGMDVGSMKSRGHKSSSWKSSVGSCSNPSSEVKFVSKQQREQITDKKDVVVTMDLATKNRCNPGNISKTSAITAEGKKTGNSMGSNINFSKPACHITTKPLIKSQYTRSRALLPGKVNRKNSSGGAKEKLGNSKFNCMTGKGKENATRNVTLNQNCNDKGVPAGGMLISQRTTKHNRLQKDDMAESVALTVLGKVNDQRKAKKSSNLARRIYLR